MRLKSKCIKYILGLFVLWMPLFSAAFPIKPLAELSGSFYKNAIHTAITYHLNLGLVYQKRNHYQISFGIGPFGSYPPSALNLKASSIFPINTWTWVAPMLSTQILWNYPIAYNNFEPNGGPTQLYNQNTWNLQAGMALGKAVSPIKIVISGGITYGFKPYNYEYRNHIPTIGSDKNVGMIFSIGLLGTWQSFLDRKSKGKPKKKGGAYTPPFY